MFNFEFNEFNSNNSFTEDGLIEQSLKNAANVDINKIKDDWGKASGIGDKNKIIRDTLSDANSKLSGDINNANNWLKNNTVDGRSVIARAKNSIVQFPVYITPSNPVSASYIISKTFERVYATMFQTVLAQNPIIDADEVNNLKFLKRFHTNLKESTDNIINKYYEAIDEFDQMMVDSIFYSEKLSENIIVEFRAIPCTDKNLILENTRLSNPPLSGLMYFREADDVTNVTKVDTKVDNNIPERIISDEALAKMLVGDKLEDIYNQIRDVAHNTALGDKDREAQLQQLRDEQDEIRKPIDEFMYKVKSSRDGVSIQKPDGTQEKVYYRKGDNGSDIFFIPGKNSSTLTSTSTHSKNVITHAVDAPKLLRDTDIKKINGLLPYTIEATFRVRDGANRMDRDVKFIIGIKTHLHLITLEDLTEDLKDLISGDERTLQKVRYTTGEIGFKDYFFNLKGLKADAAKQVTGTGKRLSLLKQLGNYEKTKGTLLKPAVDLITKGEVPVPNGTMVLTQPDVTTMLNATGIDLMEVSNAKKLAKSLFLICVVVTDTTSNIMKVLFTDSDNEWDIQSLSSLDAEIAKTDNSELMRELNKRVNR